MPYLLTDPESTNDSQPKNTRFLKIPKYFPEYIEEGGMSIPFLGASIVGKVRWGFSSWPLRFLADLISPVRPAARLRRPEWPLLHDQDRLQPPWSHGVHIRRTGLSVACLYMDEADSTSFFSPFVFLSLGLMIHEHIFSLAIESQCLPVEFVRRRPSKRTLRPRLHPPPASSSCSWRVGSDSLECYERNERRSARQFLPAR